MDGVATGPARPPLTARECEIVTLLADGLTATALGRELGISALTVRKHLQHIYRKLGCGDRLVAVDRARRAGLVAERVAPRVCGHLFDGWTGVLPPRAVSGAPGPDPAGSRPSGAAQAQGATRRP